MERSICLLNDSFPPQIDGVVNAVVNYAVWIGKKHGSAVVATPYHPAANDTAFPFPVLRYPSLDTSHWVGYRAGYPFSPQIAAELSRRRVELLHTHCPISSLFLARSLREVLAAPIVLTYHTKFDVDIANAIRSRHLQESAKRALRQNIEACDEVWVVSRGAGENLRSLGYEGEYIVMKNGVDLPRARLDHAAVAAAAAGYGLPPGVPVFLFIGRLMWYKGLRLLLDALARLKARGCAFRMLFIGDGKDAAQVRAYSENLGLAQECRFLGELCDRERLRAWYCRADVFLFPSTFDTNGLVVREAAACSLPSVLVAGSCAAEGVRDGDNGWLIEENAASLAAKLETICRAPEQLRAVGERASRTLYTSWEDSVACAVERYAIVLENYRGGHCPKHGGAMETFLRMQGELMETIAHWDGRERQAKYRMRRAAKRQWGTR